MTQTDEGFMKEARKSANRLKRNKLLTAIAFDAEDILRLLSIIDAQAKRIEELEDGLKKIEHHTDDDTAEGIARALRGKYTVQKLKLYPELFDDSDDEAKPKRRSER